MGASSRTIFKKYFLSKSWPSFHLKYLVRKLLNQNSFLRLALNICRKMWKILFFRVFNRNINFSFFFLSFFYFSTESVNKSSIYDLPFLIAIYSPKNVNKHSSEMKAQHQNNHFRLRGVCPWFGALDGRSEMVTCLQTPQKNIFWY